MDFYIIRERSTKRGVIEIYPDFRVRRSKDLMVQGRTFYAIWDEENQIWSTDEYDVQRLVDEDLRRYYEERTKNTPDNMQVKYMAEFSSGVWGQFQTYLKQLSDNAKQLDNTMIFENTETTREDYSSKRLPYALVKGEIPAYEELMSTLYDPEERAKLEWAIGAVISGDAKTIQKFLVLYGESGAGKSTVLNIIEDLFEGYYATFDAKALTSSGNAFSTAVFKTNPLAAIQHDGDLSKIEDNTRLNSIVSHEKIMINEKYIAGYSMRMNSFLFMGTNEPVKITNSKSGIIRRLIDVTPSGRRIPTRRYHKLVNQIKFELGGIAYHCLETYKQMGKNYYSDYRPIRMIFQTDVFFNFMEAYYFTFAEEDGVTLKRAYTLYKEYCEEALIPFKLPMYKFREELKSYFTNFDDRVRIDDVYVRSYYSGFIKEKFEKMQAIIEDEPVELMIFDKTESLFDKMYPSAPAQYANKYDTPSQKWDKVKTTLKGLNTKKLHYVQPPLNHIVIDFDIKDSKGEKSLERNIEEASKWPATYGEYSKSGKGIHLHYIYEGDPEQLSRIYDNDIEIKVFVGNSSLRRQLTFCNDIPIATLTSGLPLKGGKMINVEAVQTERRLRNLIKKNLRKEIHASTKPSVDFIHKLLEDAYTSGLNYDVTDMRPAILAFANNSTNQAEYCVKLVGNMKFQSEEASKPQNNYSSEELVFFDVEVFPNLFMIVWKFQGEGKELVVMTNPTPEQMGEFLQLKLVGFNCRRYDNHIMYARYLGYSNEELYNLSQKIINNSRNAYFAEAYGISYTDIYDFSSKKQSLKKFEIELGIPHKELDIPWDESVPKKLWGKIAEYAKNDVLATEATFNARHHDFVARLILAELSGLTPNDTTQRHTAKIIFGDVKKPQSSFVYTDLTKEFPGYKFDHGKSYYKDELVGEGGYVYGEPGMYTDVAVLDVTSMHPNSIINLNLFGPYTKNFEELVNARIHIKHEEYDIVRGMFNGKIAKFLEDPQSIGDLSYALKIPINIVYGLTAASFDNPFRDIRNVDNIVAKRGALFMIDLKHHLQEKGIKVVHIKTDSIKIPNATKKIIKEVQEIGRQYGYEFEHETTYEKFCLVNNAVFISKDENGWSATGAQFAHPYVFKALFSKESITPADLVEVRNVTTALYLDMNENLEDVTKYEKELANRQLHWNGEEGTYQSSDPNLSKLSNEDLVDRINKGHDYVFVGKVGAFYPIKEGCNGGILLREKNGEYHAANNSKGYRWLEVELVNGMDRYSDIDMEYYNNLANTAAKDIAAFGDFEWFTNN